MLAATVPENLQSRYRKVFRFLRSKGLQLRYANVGGRFTHFFRNDELVKIVEAYDDYLRAQLNSHGSALEQIRKGLVFLERSVTQRPLKYPTSLKYSNSQGQFATLPFDFSENLTALVASTLIAVIFIVLLPIMPLIIRFWVWKSCLYSLLVIGFVVAVRAIVAAVGYFLGLRLRLLPNLLLDTTFKRRLSPFILCVKEKPLEEIMVRVINVWVICRIVMMAAMRWGRITGRRDIELGVGLRDIISYFL